VGRVGNLFCGRASYVTYNQFEIQNGDFFNKTQHQQTERHEVQILLKCEC
jgi:hypothetical protein